MENAENWGLLMVNPTRVKVGDKDLAEFNESQLIDKIRHLKLEHLFEIPPLMSSGEGPVTSGLAMDMDPEKRWMMKVALGYNILAQSLIDEKGNKIEEDFKVKQERIALRRQVEKLDAKLNSERNANAVKVTNLQEKNDSLVHEKDELAHKYQELIREVELLKKEVERRGRDVQGDINMREAEALASASGRYCPTCGLKL